GRQWHALQPHRAIGCVVEPACEVIAPGVIAHHDFNRFVIGEPDGSRSSRVLALGEALTAAGFDAPVRDDIRWNIWLKLWGNVCLNPISALTGATLDRIVGDPGLLRLCRAMMLETQAVNEALGVHIPADMMERRLAAAAKLAGHKMSMLQDMERGRPLEIDALVTAVQELGRLAAVATPTVDAPAFTPPSEVPAHDGIHHPPRLPAPRDGAGSSRMPGPLRCGQRADARQRFAG